MAATAEVLTNPDEIKKAMDIFVKKFPFLANMPASETPLAVVKVTPQIISVLNYELGFGHTDLIAV